MASREELLNGVEAAMAAVLDMVDATGAPEREGIALRAGIEEAAALDGLIEAVERLLELITDVAPPWALD